MILKCNATIADDLERKELFSFVRKVAVSYSEIGQTIHMTYNGDDERICLEIIDKFESCEEHGIEAIDLKEVILCHEIVEKNSFHT